MNSPLVSVIMPAYNAGKYIKESIDSVKEQTYTHWELIVIDDGSIDDTAIVVNESTQSDSRIRYIYQENGKQGKARNNGIKSARGEYLAFLDADDLWVPEKLEKQIESIRTADADLVFSGFSVFTSSKKNGVKQNEYPGYYKGEDGLRKFLVNNYIPILTVLVKKKVVESVDYFSETPAIQNAEDYHLWLKLLAAGYTLFGEPGVLAYYRLHNTSSSAKDRQVIFPALNSLKELARKYPEKGIVIKESFLKRIDNYIEQNNITDWDFIKRLLVLKSRFIQKQSSLFWAKAVHQFFGKRAFRYFYKLSLTKNERLSTDINLESILI